MNSNRLKLVAALTGAVTYASSLLAQNIGQWDFNNGDLSQSSGANLGPLSYNDGPTGQTAEDTVFGSTTMLGIPNINGTVANVIHFPGGPEQEGILMPTPPGNGGGTLVNEYTLIIDVLYSQDKTLRPLLEMDSGSEDNIQALWAIGADNTLQTTNTAGAAAQFTTWSTTNLALPHSQWVNLGHPAEVTPGNYQVGDPSATTNKQTFYKVTSP